MTPEELHREMTIKGLADLLRRTPFSIEFNVKKKPSGIKFIIEVTQEELDDMLKSTGKKETDV